jgi:hypothetical protein
MTTQGLHRLLGIQPRLLREACEGHCYWRDSHGCPRRAVAALQTLGGQFRGLCEPHAAQGHRLGYGMYCADGSRWEPSEAVPAG